MLTALILASAMVPAVPSETTEVEALARRAASMPSYTFVLRRDVNGVPKRAERLDTITGRFVAGKPLNMKQGTLEVYAQNNRVALRDGEGDWGLVDFANPFRSRGVAAPNWLSGMSASSRRSSRVDGKNSQAASTMARMVAAQLGRVAPPHDLLTRLPDCMENVRVSKTANGKTVITGNLNEDATKAYRPAVASGGRARFRGQGGVHWTTESMIHVIVGTDGYPTHYDLTLHFQGTKQGHPFEQTRQQFVEISNVATTSLRIPDDVEEMFAD